MIKIGITTGDKDGVGLEVALKALNSIKLNDDIEFYLWCDSAASLPNLNKTIHIMKRHEPEPEWFKEVIQWAKDKRIDGIVTGPLSKKTIINSGSGKMGHTEILKSEFPKHDIFMTFSGEFFNTLLLTTHIPIDDVTNRLTSETIGLGIKAAKDWALKNNDSRPVALVGLNPHAGEDGLIGKKDIELKALCQKHKIVGPLVPDVAFLKKYWDQYSIYICCYHDLALIPFKMAHNHEKACQISWGLPIIRTSVDHGTAKDIFGKNKASADSMIYAINKAIQLIRNQSKG